ncbi:hypothetical protein IFM89_000683 [Coptis chinensis]|uniref:RING-CH-type domain-containing protein n=1 Tax=Coptis chinensis TaxID=261450 RepID=A0A835IJF8_9MAGN|nr:hypothetical protein IFM89_000683 [Coptis chinensis]
MDNREVVLFVEKLLVSKASTISQCRICHEEEVESCKSLEAPCACSGTVKFAHRDCIQRWCNEKGNTICEICLQKFEPGYTAPSRKAQLDDVTVIISGSLDVRRENQELLNPGLMAIVAIDNDTSEPDYSECSSAAERSANCCRSVAITFSILLLVRHFLVVLTSGTDEYAFTLLTLFLLRAGGILLPLYIMIRIISAIQNSLQRLYTEADETSSEGDEEELLHPATQIHS